ncbi:diacylglycerol cholinephosphotransferase Mf1 [Mycoplasma sp. Mirounga ES2805-ORL]|uniref:diacylglycerol cholinephosphotransferase Mf1 n=1 Tax=Mycoplasma sp. Mirounga ES2805-ORL TaxID=754514 RepID=UPI00197B13D7|nr:LicD family protein [Mycoplasma sp. Mirounga ES2805-ORL]QSF13936.1 LicD family protein [Mycoplasma sp. Mirounga ES2805-ORL]
MNKKSKNHPSLPENIKSRQLGNLKLLKEVTDILSHNNFDYSLIYGTALGAVRDNKIIEWDTDIDIVIKQEAYDFLLKNYPDRLLTNENSKEHFLTFPRFIESRKKVDFKDPNSLYIDLFIAIPSTKQKIYKYNKSKLNVLRGLKAWTGVNYYFTKKILRTLSRIFVKGFLWTKKLSYKETYKQLHDNNPEVYALSTWPSKHSSELWIELNAFDNMKKVKFNDNEYYIINNIEQLFEKEYGSNWRTPIKTKGCHYYGFFETAND